MVVVRCGGFDRIGRLGCDEGTNRTDCRGGDYDDRVRESAH